MYDVSANIKTHKPKTQTNRSEQQNIGVQNIGVHMPKSIFHPSLRQQKFNKNHFVALLAKFSFAQNLERNSHYGFYKIGT